MKKITSLIVALVFTISIALAVVNSAVSTQNNDSGNVYALIQGPPPPPPTTGDKTK